MDDARERFAPVSDSGSVAVNLGPPSLGPVRGPFKRIPRARFGYLDAFAIADSPRSELRLGSADERGAAHHGVEQTTWAGWVSALQQDLTSLGFHPGPCDGFYGPQTARAVEALQDEASRCACETGVATYHGAVDGSCNGATRLEIRRWLDTVRRRHRARLTPARMEAIVRRAAIVLSRGGDAYAHVSGASSSNGAAGSAAHGIGLFSQRRGDLGELLQRFLFVDRDAFRRVFGWASGRRLILETTARDAATRAATPLGDLWAERFVAAAAIPVFRAEQERLTRVNAFEPLLDVAHDEGIFHERGLALLWRANARAGIDVAAAVARAIGPRPVGTTPAQHFRDAAERLFDGRDGVVRAAGTRSPALAEDLQALATTPGFQDCEELCWW